MPLTNVPPVPEKRDSAARQYLWLALACLAGALYGSFVPFHFRWRPFGEAWDEYVRIVTGPLTWQSGADSLANVLLFMPLTFLWMAALTVDRSPRMAALTAVWILPSASLLSACIEFTQLYFPPRVTALDDIVADTQGGAIGILLWLSLGQRVTARGRRLWAVLEKEGWAGRVLPHYLFVLAVLHLMPIDLTISPAMIQAKYETGRIVLTPFASMSKNFMDSLPGFAWDVFCYAPLGYVLASLHGPGWRCWRRLPLIVAIAFVTALTMETLQVFVWSRQSDVSDALVGMAAIVAVWMTTVSMSHWRTHGIHG
jgi:VanZ family protein